VVEAIRAEVPPLGQDRPMAPDMERAARLVRDGRLVAAAGMGKEA
jgi:histidine ammonia-lyase